MKILLVGEYSRLHNSLKEGLTALGHEVRIVATGDAFKDFQVDYSIKPKFCSNYWIAKKVRNAIHKWFSLDIGKYEIALRSYFLLPKLENFDHVQIINSDALETTPTFSRYFYKRLFSSIKSRSLLVCGDETPVINYLLKKELPYSILTPYFKNSALKKQFQYSLKYVTPNYRKTFEYVKEHCQSIICSDIDYKIPMEKMGYAIHFIPNPINSSIFSNQQMDVNDKIVIFLGINRLSYHKKGIHYFEEALTIIQEKYGEKVSVIITENVPYKEYIEKYNAAHIVLDQIYGFDQGYNALEAMAKGKVVFTGASKEFMKHYQLAEQVAINALPNTDAIVKELASLIENPNEIKAMGKRARAFIEKEHDGIVIAKKYLGVWK